MGKIDRKTVDLGIEHDYSIAIPEACHFAVGKLHGIGSRENQQDAFGVSDNAIEMIQQKGFLAVVADGMGGMSDGARASMTTVISCLNYFETTPWTEEIPRHMEAMAHTANEQVREILGSMRNHGGSTLAAAYLKDNILHWVTVGDSKIMLYRNQELIQLNVEHNYAAQLQIMVESGEITSDEAENDSQKNALTSYIGIENLTLIDSNQEPLELKSGDKVILMSDGVFNSLSENEICESLSMQTSRAMMHMGMQIEGKRMQRQDNYTALMIEIRG